VVSLEYSQALKGSLTCLWPLRHWGCQGDSRGNVAARPVACCEVSPFGVTKRERSWSFTGTLMLPQADAVLFFLEETRGGVGTSLRGSLHLLLS
jgi:hypothetical protein